MSDIIPTAKQTVIVRPPAGPKKPEGPQPFKCGRLRMDRTELVQKINDSALAPEDKVYVLAKLAKLPAELKLIELHFHAHPHRSGENATVTVTEL